MPKNASVYINDKLVKRLEAFPEVNISEVMRKGLENYLDNREAQVLCGNKVYQNEEEIRFLKTTFNSNFDNMHRMILELKKKIDELKERR